MKHRSENSFWQSYADLAMGLVGVFSLLLILLLIKEQETSKDLEAERKEFAQELMQLLESSQEIVTQQDQLNDWLASVFNEGSCDLRLTPSGQLSLGESDRGPAQLYDSGSVALQRQAEQALKGCLENFRKLAICLSPDDESRARCAALDQGTEFEQSDAVRAELRQGIEALVLQGNTDQDSYLQAPPIRSIDGWYGLEEHLSKSFVNNAFLGSERARQALGHLLRLVEQDGADINAPLQVLMSRVRVESPSFGRYQAGPLSYQVDGESRPWREGDCPEGSCEEARNLSLLLRWRKSALRQPYNQITAEFCELLANENTAFYKGLEDAGENPREVAARLCPGPD